MNRFLHGVVRAFSETFDLPGPILEVGAYQVEGQEAIADVRALFPGRDYIGLDMRSGPGVDCVASVEALPQADASVGAVIALNTFEHVRRFWRGFDEVRRVLRPDGMLLVSCPFFFRVHNYPQDYWRFTPQALEALLERYPSKIIGWHGPRHRPLHVWALACRERRPAITQAQFAHYQTLLGRYAKDEGDGWGRSLRYAIAGIFCGRGPFAPYLDRNRWETICKNDPVQFYRLSAQAPTGMPTAPDLSR